jgi:hypothetical protein
MTFLIRFMPVYNSRIFRFGGTQDREILPLLLRGWAFQERLLALRVLHFTQNEFDLGVCGALYLRVLATYTKHRLTQINSPVVNPKIYLRFRSLRKQTWDLKKLWEYLVRSYSCLDLSYEDDKLPALSGVAQLIQRTTNDTYLAGMGKRQLPMSLCWLTSAQSSLTTRPRRWRAPSWSWASLDGRIEYASSSERDIWLINVLDANCEPSGVDATGRVSSGFIVLLGFLEPWEVNDLENDIYCFDCSDGNNECRRGNLLYCLPIRFYNYYGREYLDSIILKKLSTTTETVSGLNRDWLQRQAYAYCPPSSTR